MDVTQDDDYRLSTFVGTETKTPIVEVVPRPVDTNRFTPFRPKYRRGLRRRPKRQTWDLEPDCGRGVGLKDGSSVKDQNT